MKTQQRGLWYVANALLAEVSAAVSSVLALLEMGRLKLGSFAASSPACSAGITQALPATEHFATSGGLCHLRWMLISNPDTVFVVHFVCLYVVSTKHPCMF